MEGRRKSDCDRLKDLKYQIDESQKSKLKEALLKMENLSRMCDLELIEKVGRKGLIPCAD